jgi:hypothetical protein
LGVQQAKLLAENISWQLDGALGVICLLSVMVSVEAAETVSALPVMVSLRPDVYSSIK